MPFEVDAQSTTPETAQKLIPAKGSNDIGIIFNADSLLLDFESYQAGFGVKVGKGENRVRGLLDVVANGGSGSFAVYTGAAYEHHLLPEPVSFYVGGSLKAGYMQQSGVSRSILLSPEAIAGIEVFPFRFLSFFLEYSLAADFTITTDIASSLTSFDYLVDTRMGNGSKIGIVIYIMRSAEKKQPSGR